MQLFLLLSLLLLRQLHVNIFTAPSGPEVSHHPSTSYGPPKPEYGPPTGHSGPTGGFSDHPPSSGYGAPSSSYDAPSSSYGAPSDSYGAPPSHAYLPQKLNSAYEGNVMVP